jgi:putative nucleotidyltransferase with HDIG domain
VGSTANEKTEGVTEGPGAKPAAAAAGRNQGHGQRLTAAFEALEEFPALAEPRNRLLRLVRDAHPATGEVVAAVESDVALAIAVMRLANRAGPRAGQIASIPAAVEVLGPAGVESLTMRTAVFDFFERTPAWDTAPERFRLHAVATQRAADRVAREIGWEDRDSLLVAALLHDVGRLVLTHAYSSYPDEIHAGARTPEERVMRERRELGVDHGVVGGVLARRWGLPQSLSRAIERHHSNDATGAAAIVRLADMLAHHAQGRAVDPGRLLSVARTVGLEPPSLRGIMYELPYGAASGRRRAEPCPLSAREVQILKKLAEGKVYKQIAADLTLSTSTVRTHLHNIYGKMGAVDRAQAVLAATEKGWL